MLKASQAAAGPELASGFWNTTHPLLIQDARFTPCRKYSHAKQKTQSTLKHESLHPNLLSCLSYAKGGFYNEPSVSASKPGEVPSCIIFDECYPDIVDGPLIRKHAALKSKDLRIPVSPAIKDIEINNESSWGIVSLAFPESYADTYNQGRAEQNEMEGDNAFKKNTTRRGRKAAEELLFPQRGLDFVEASALNVSTATPTSEEMLQNVAAMEVFYPGWSSMFEKGFNDAVPLRSVEANVPALISRQLHQYGTLNSTRCRDTSSMTLTDKEFTRTGERTSWPSIKVTVPETHEIRSMPTMLSRIAEENTVFHNVDKSFIFKTASLDQRLNDTMRQPYDAFTVYPYPRLPETRRNEIYALLDQPMTSFLTDRQQHNLSNKKIFTTPDIESPHTTQGSKFYFRSSPLHGNPLPQGQLNSTYTNPLESEQLSMEDVRGMSFMQTMTKSASLSHYRRPNYDDPFCAVPTLDRSSPSLLRSLNGYLSRRQSANIPNRKRHYEGQDKHLIEYPPKIDTSLHIQHHEDFEQRLEYTTPGYSLRFPRYHMLMQPSTFFRSFEIPIKKQPDNLASYESPTIIPLSKARSETNLYSISLDNESNSVGQTISDSTSLQALKKEGIRTRIHDISSDSQRPWLLDFETLYNMEVPPLNEKQLSLRQREKEQSEAMEQKEKKKDFFIPEEQTHKIDIPQVRSSRRLSLGKDDVGLRPTIDNEAAEYVKYNEDDIGSGYYWEDLIEQQQIANETFGKHKKSVVSLQTLRARRLHALERRQKEAEEHKQKLLEEQLKLRKAAIAIQQSQAASRQLHYAHQRNAALLKNALDQTRKIKINKLQKSIATGQLDTTITISDKEYWSWEKDEDDTGISSEDSLSEIYSSNDESEKAKKKRFVTAIRRSKIKKTIRFEQRSHQQKRINEIRRQLANIGKDQEFRYKPKLLSQKEVLEAPVIFSGWLRQNQASSKSSLMYFELRKSVLLFYVPKHDFLKHLRTFSARGYKYSLPIKSSQFPEDKMLPQNIYSFVTFVDGIALNNSKSSIELRKTVSCDDDEEKVVFFKHGKRYETPTSSKSMEQKRSSKVAAAFIHKLSLGRSDTFKSGTWRIRNEHFLVIQGSLFTSLPTTVIHAIKMQNSFIELKESSSSNLIFTLCAQAADEEKTRLWYLYLKAACASEKYIQQCLAFSGVYPSREAIYSLEYAAQQDPFNDESHEELYLQGTPWSNKTMYPLLDIIKSVQTIKALDFSRTNIPSDTIIDKRLCEWLCGERQTHISSLQLSNNILDLKCILEVHNLIARLQCKALVLDNCGIGETEVSGLSSIFKDTCLEVLSLRNNPIDKSALVELSKIVQNFPLNHQLQFLLLEGCQLVCKYCLQYLKRLENFKGVFITNTNDAEGIHQSKQDPFLYLVPNRDHKNIPALHACYISSLFFSYKSELDLSCWTFSSEFELTDLFRFLCFLPHIRRLRLSYAKGFLQIDMDRFKTSYDYKQFKTILTSHIEPFSTLSSFLQNDTHLRIGQSLDLVSLYMEGSEFNFSNLEQIIAFSAIVTGCKCRILDISYCPQLKTATPTCFATLIRLILFRSSVKILIMNRAFMTDDVVFELKTQMSSELASTTSSLEVFQLCHNHISQKGIVQLLTLIGSKLPAIVHIDITGNPCGSIDVLCSSLKNMLPRHTLQAIDLDNISSQKKADLLIEELEFLEKEDAGIVTEDQITQRIEELWYMDKKKRQQQFEKRKQDKILKVEEHKKKVEHMKLEAKKQNVSIRMQKNGRTELRYSDDERLNIRLERLQHMNELVEKVDFGVSLPAFQEEVQEFLRNEKLSTINFSERDFNISLIFEALQTVFPMFQAIDSLVFSHMDMRNSEFLKLSTWFIECGISIKSLDLSFNQLGPAIFDNILKLLEVAQISKLILDGNDFGDSLNAALFFHFLCKENQYIRILSLRGGGIGDSFALKLMELLEEQEEKKLSTNTDNLNLIKLNKTKKQSSLCRLRRLRLQHNNMSLIGLRNIIIYISTYCPHILSLELGGNQSDFNRSYLRCVLRQDPLMRLHKRILSKVSCNPTFARRGIIKREKHNVKDVGNEKKIALRK